MLIVCGGARTEPDYFKGLKQVSRNPAVTVKVVVEPRDPETVVERARDQLASGDFDEAWCVLDVDQFMFDRALATARDAGVSLAISNPCFELWLLLHWQDVHAALTGAKAAQTKLKVHLPTYDKTALRFVDFSAGIADAVRRAKELHGGDEPLGPNPSSGVWRLVGVVTDSAALG